MGVNYSIYCERFERNMKRNTYIKEVNKDTAEPKGAEDAVNLKAADIRSGNAEISQSIEDAKDENEDIYSLNTGAANRLHYKNEPTIILDAEDNLEMLDRPVKEKLSIWKKREGAKLKDMHGKDKVKYIFAYYYQWMIVAAAVIFIIYVGLLISYRMGLNTRLNVIVFDDPDSNAEEYLEKAVPDYFEFGKKDRLVVNSTVNLKEVNGASSAEETADQTEAEDSTEAAEGETGTASGVRSDDIVRNMKLMTMSLAGTIDIMIGGKDSFTGYAVEAGLVLDISEYIPADLYRVVENDIIYTVNPDGETVAAAIKMPEDFADKLKLNYEPYASICCTTKNERDCVNFIRMMYGLDYIASEE